jgi:hypothetical protein
LSFQSVWLFGDEAFSESLLVVRMETAPENGIALASGDSARGDEYLGEVVEFAVVIDDVGLITHAFPGILVCEVHQLLLRELTFGGWVDVFFAQLVAEVEPVSVDVALHDCPDMAYRVVNIPNDHLHLL